MAFAITHSGRRAPREGDLVDTAESLSAALAAAGRGAFTLWSVQAVSGSARPPRKVLRWAAAHGRDPTLLAGEVMDRMMAHVEWGYLNGDCWVLAHVGAARHGLQVAMVVNDWCAEGEPAHLALDLGGGLYLDAKGVSSEADLLARCPAGSRLVPERLGAGEVGVLYDSLYAEDHGEFSEKLEDGFEEDTVALFATCLDRFVPATPAPTPGSPAT